MVGFFYSMGIFVFFVYVVVVIEFVGGVVMIFGF